MPARTQIRRGQIVRTVATADFKWIGSCETQIHIVRIEVALNAVNRIEYPRLDVGPIHTLENIQHPSALRNSGNLDRIAPVIPVQVINAIQWRTLSTGHYHKLIKRYLA